MKERLVPTRIYDWLHEISCESVEHQVALTVPHHAIRNAPGVRLRSVHEIPQSVTRLVRHVVFIQSTCLVENDKRTNIIIGT